MTIEQLRDELVMLNAEYAIYIEKRNGTRDAIMYAAYSAKLEQIDKQIEAITNKLGLEMVND